MDKINEGCYIEGYERLAVAVVKQAALDYDRALRKLKRKPYDSEAFRMVNDCERFFRNEISMYSEIDGECIMKEIRKRVNGGDVR